MFFHWTLKKKTNLNKGPQNNLSHKLSLENLFFPMRNVFIVK